MQHYDISLKKGRLSLQALFRKRINATPNTQHGQLVVGRRMKIHHFEPYFSPERSRAGDFQKKSSSRLDRRACPALKDRPRTDRQEAGRAERAPGRPSVAIPRATSRCARGSGSPIVAAAPVSVVCATARRVPPLRLPTRFSRVATGRRERLEES